MEFPGNFQKIGVRIANSNLFILYCKVMASNLNSSRTNVVTQFQLTCLLIFILTIRLVTDNEKYVHGIL